MLTHAVILLGRRSEWLPDFMSGRRISVAGGPGKKALIELEVKEQVVFGWRLDWELSAL